MRTLSSLPLRASIPVLLLSCAAAASLSAWRLDVRLVEREIEKQSIVAGTLRITRLQATLEYLIRQRDSNGIRMEVSGLATHSDVLAAFVIDEQDRIVAATRYATIGRPAATIASELPEDLRSQHADRIAEVRSVMTGRVVLSADRHMTASYYPLLVAVNEHTLRPVRRGLVIVLTDIQLAKSNANAAAGHQAITYLLLFSGLAGGAWLFLHFTLTRRVARLVATTGKLASGDLGARTGIAGNDELGLVAKAFDVMAARIAEDIRSREQAEQALRQSVSLLQATIEATADGLMIVDHEGRIVSFNARFASLWRIPPAILESRDDDTVLAHAINQLKAPDAFLQKVRELYANREAESFDLMEFKDGRIFERYSCPQRLDGVAVGRVWSFRDITERRRAQAERDVLNQQLVKASRQAGMAEVATNVLHNVGNVLNSVNVSASLIAQRVQQSPLVGLSKVVAVLREQEHDLATFISRDTRGQHLPAYLAKLCEHLLTEQAATLAEAESLQKNIEHIKGIITMQQRYARTSGVKELVDVIDLVEDSVRMNADSLRRHGVEIIREFADDLPCVNLEKHKVLQILVNLIGNANQACRESNRHDKRLTLRVAKAHDEIQIDVIDNGAGIAPENMTRIFSHGFTTRKDGHGFGLHSGVLAAQEMGGSLSAHSEGMGRGATFTLLLPLRVAAISP